MKSDILIRAVTLGLALVGQITAADPPPSSTPESVSAHVAKVWSKDVDEAIAARALEADPLALPLLRWGSVADPSPYRREEREEGRPEGQAAGEEVARWVIRNGRGAGGPEWFARPACLPLTE